jgi:Uma2 family endonuclease
MTTAKSGLLTADDLLRLDSQGVKGELIRGVLHETMSVGGRHGEIGGALISEIRPFVRSRRLGRVGGTDAGVLLERNPDTVREPDVLFISAEKLPLDVEVTGYYEVVPDLVAEVRSPSDTLTEFNAKIVMWLDFGVRLVLAIFPATRTVTVHQPDRPPTNLTYDDTLDGGDVLPGFRCRLRDVFDL